jgi:tetratricopeptide (TPR) repeat protein
MAPEVRVRRSLATILVAAALFSCAALGLAGGPPSEQSGSTAEAVALVAEAQLRLASGEIAEGLKLFRRASELDPDNAELAEEFGLALADAGMGDEAIKQLRKVSRLTPGGEATLGILLAQTAQSPSELDAAVAHLTNGVDAFPQGDQARMVLAQSLLRMGKGSQAWLQVQVLLDEHPNDARLWVLAGQALRQTGKYDEAVAYLKRAAAVPELRPRATLELVDTLAADRKFKEAADVLGEFLKKEGATLSGLTRWATLLARAGDRGKATEVLDQVLASDQNQHDALLLKAMLEAGNGHVDAAEQLYRRAIAANPDDPDAKLGLARLLIDSRRLPEARTLLDGLWKQVQDKKLDSVEAAAEIAQERATLELLDHKTEAALTWLRKVSNGPLERRQLALWGEYYRLRESYREGFAFIRDTKIEEEKEATRLRESLLVEFGIAAGDEGAVKPILERLFDGEAEDVVAAMGALDRRKLYAEAAARGGKASARLGDPQAVLFAHAAALERSGKWDEAVVRFRKLLLKQPDNATALNYLGYMFADKGVNLDEARTMLVKAVSLDPTSGAFQDSLGWVYFRLGELDRAEKHLTEGLRLEPFDATVNEHIGDLFRARGEKARAAEAYGKALTLGPEEEGQKERIEKKLAEVKGAPAP